MRWQGGRGGGIEDHRRMGSAGVGGLGVGGVVGDDTLQRKSQGRVMPDAFTHGSSEQRMAWFRKGSQSGDPDACDTFGAGRL